MTIALSSLLFSPIAIRNGASKTIEPRDGNANLLHFSPSPRPFIAFKAAVREERGNRNRLNKLVQGGPTVFYSGNGSIIYMLFERRHTCKNRKISIKQHIEYFNFRSKTQLDHRVQQSRWPTFFLPLSRCDGMRPLFFQTRIWSHLVPEMPEWESSFLGHVIIWFAWLDWKRMLFINARGVQGGWGGCRTGNGEKLSNSQVCFCALLLLIFFLFPVWHPPHPLCRCSSRGDENRQVMQIQLSLFPSAVIQTCVA